MKANGNPSSYTSKRLSDWINNLDPQLIDAYDVPISINMNKVDKEEVSTIRSLLNSLYNVAKELDIRIVVNNTLNKFSELTHFACNHHLKSCNAPQTLALDLFQKLKAIANQTKYNSRKIEVVMEE